MCLDAQRRRLLAGTAALAGASLLPPAARAAPARRPNILFILADDLGAADIGAYGVRDIKTPALDRLAREGLVFDRAYANSAVCSATRTALITGRYQYRLRCGLEEPIAGANKLVGLPPEVPTLPSLLHKAGYSTALVGKWHLGSPPEYGPLKSGYQHFYGFIGGAADYFTHQAKAGVQQFFDGDHFSQDQGYLTDLLGERAVRLVSEFARTPDPFFISLHFNAPHWPWEGVNDQAESERIRTSKDGDAALFAYDAGSRRKYAQMVERMDLQIGKVLEALDQRGLTDNTLIIFTSDNGGERFSDTWPFTGMKGELLEGGLRVPAVVRWPAAVRGGARSDQAILSVDWLPTLLAAAGGKADPGFPSDGQDLAPVLASPALNQPRQLFWRYKRKHQRAHVDGRWKYLRIDGREFLFDVVEDPRERANLKDRHPDIFARLSREWEAWNAQMLPELKETYTWGPDAAHFADHYGAVDDLP
jgi:arylsulfatase A-like enzyme